MYISDEEIDSVRNDIASIAYNDCLPTALATNTLKEICHQYDNYVNNQDSHDRESALNALRISMNLLNKQSVSTGCGNNIFHPKDNESVLRTAKTVATIYAIPYKADLDIDYIGYAYGQTSQKFKNPDIYETYRPSTYLNQCSRVVLDHSDANSAENLYALMLDSVNALKSLTAENRDYVMEEINSKMSHVDDCIKEMNGEPALIQSKMHAKTITACINSDYEFSKKGRIESMREDDIFSHAGELSECIEF